MDADDDQLDATVTGPSSAIDASDAHGRAPVDGPRARAETLPARGPRSSPPEATPRSGGVVVRGVVAAAPAPAPEALRGVDTATGPDPRVGRVLAGRYQIERPLARGGMGRVYVATQLGLQRKVAIKVLNPEFRETDPQFVRRFTLEASISARLSHPHVVTIHDYGESEDGELFMAMELLRGRTLSTAIAADGAFAPARVLHVALAIARALREAHAMGVIHRDLKPGNVMLCPTADDPDFVKVLDFGLVKLFARDGEPLGQALGLGPDLAEDITAMGPVDEQAVTAPARGGLTDDLTRAGTLLGSPRYMAPEQIRGEPLDPRTDVYALGCLVFQMASGRPPFVGSSTVDLIYKHLHEAPPRIGDVHRATPCPIELERVVAAMLEKRRERRPGSMDEVIDALKAARFSITGVAYELPMTVAPGASSAHGARGVPEVHEPTGPVDVDERSVEPVRRAGLAAALRGAAATPLVRPASLDPEPPSGIDDATRLGPRASSAFEDLASARAALPSRAPGSRRQTWLGLAGVGLAFAGAVAAAALWYGGAQPPAASSSQDATAHVDAPPTEDTPLAVDAPPSVEATAEVVAVATTTASIEATATASSARVEGVSARVDGAAATASSEGAPTSVERARPETKRRRAREARRDEGTRRRARRGATSDSVDP